MAESRWHSRRREGQNRSKAGSRFSRQPFGGHAPARVRANSWQKGGGYAAASEVFPVLQLIIGSLVAGHASHDQTRAVYKRRHVLGTGGFVKLKDDDHCARIEVQETQNKVDLASA